jgi:soluble lytic murein transglycosylase
MRLYRTGFITPALLAVMLVSSLHSKIPDLSGLDKMPPSIEKDYYIWRFISQPGTKASDAKKAIRQVVHLNGKLIKAYRKKTGHTPPKPVASCGWSLAKFYATGGECAIQPKKAESSSTTEKRSALYRVLSSDKPIALWRDMDDETKVYILNHAGKAGRKKLDHTPDAQEWKGLTRVSGFNRTISLIEREKLSGLSSGFLLPPAKDNALNYKTKMSLGFRALTSSERKVAAIYFADSAKKSERRDEVDRALFWTWMATKEKSYLSQLTRSYDINIYTLAARDLLKLKYPRVLTPRFKENGKAPAYVKDPIVWARIKKKIYSGQENLKRLASTYENGESIGYYTYILTRASRDKEQYFPMPYRDMMVKLPQSRQAILYAIARQESKFVPSSVSRSFALGMMQIMPFLVDHISKERGEKIDYDDMFDPRKALVYANHHMNYLNKWLKHPLFVAYAYNAGIGYTKRMLLAGRLFKSTSGLEPWLSIEAIDNAQAREYGKKVLTNYVIYMNLLGSPTRLLDLVLQLDDPSKTDRFRK